MPTTLKRREVLTALKKLGLAPSKLGKGSHEVWVHRDGRRCTVSICREFDRGGLKHIYAPLGLTQREFFAAAA